MGKELTPLEELENNVPQCEKVGEFAWSFVGSDLVFMPKKHYENLNEVLRIIKNCCLLAKYPDNTYELAFCKKICIEKEEYDLLKEFF